MEIPVFLAMTAAEVSQAEELPERTAWMACHFSAYGTGISNLPKALPPGSMLMLNDRTPLCGHAPEQVAQMLCKTAENLHCDSILLDFQRENQEGIDQIIREILEQSTLPVGVSHLYAQDFDCPVLLPPVPPHQPLETALKDWNNKEIWLELTTHGTQITVTQEGSGYTPLAFYSPPDNAHCDRELCCHYEIETDEKEARFFLGRTEADLQALLEKAKTFRISRFLRLWQEAART